MRRVTFDWADVQQALGLKAETERTGTRKRTVSPASVWVFALVMMGFVGGLPAAAQVVFQDLERNASAGLDYQRAPSATIAIFDQLNQLPLFSFAQLPISPIKPHGAPGVALLDYDGDDDLDIYVTNGPGVANSLFKNLGGQGMAARFVDVGAAAGVGATDQDGSGVCFGDIDNDGDRDLLVLSFFDGHRLFENQGDGTFVDISAASGVAALTGHASSCSFGDLDNDGLLDVVIANTSVDLSNSLAIVTPFDFNQHNDLLHNLGNNTFADVAAARGLRDTSGFTPPIFDGQPTLTWAIAMVDIDADGDVDIVQADDQAGVPFARDGGVDRGLLQVFQNDGTGQLTNVTAALGLNEPGAWMGLAFGDLNRDGHLDVFGSNLGDWAQTLISPLDPQYGIFTNYMLGDLSSRWYLGSAAGAFTSPGLGPIVATPFGWGACMADYDNDSDTDILFHGGLYFGPVVQTAPEGLMRNDGSGVFHRDVDAFATSVNHEGRNVQGVAMGDLDGNGFVDVVSVSNFDLPGDEIAAPYNHHWGSPFDGGTYGQLFVPTGDGTGNAVPSGVALLPGSLSVELNGGNGHRSITVETLGTVGLTSAGTVNRDGIGARVTVRPQGQPAAIRPVVGGASYASQDSLAGVFGMSDARRAHVEVAWPGGVRNRLYFVRAGERVTVPEIPCRFDDPSVGLGEYLYCVGDALRDLRHARMVTPREASRLFISSLLAYFEG